MNLIVDKNELKMSFISGPRNNFLSISLSDSLKKIEDFDVYNIGGNNFKNKEFIKDKELNDKFVKKQVLDGLRLINKKLNKDYRLEYVKYLNTDTYSEKIYKDLLFEIIKKAFEKGILK